MQVTVFGGDIVETSKIEIQRGDRTYVITEADFEYFAEDGIQVAVTEGSLMSVNRNDKTTEIRSIV